MRSTRKNNINGRDNPSVTDEVLQANRFMKKGKSLSEEEIQLTLSKKQEKILQKRYPYCFPNVSRSQMYQNAVMVPLYMKREKEIIENYRPISFLFVIPEKILPTF